jgi:beta-galactosidase
MKKLFGLLFFLVMVAPSGCTRYKTKSEILSLNGSWEFAESRSFGEIPSDFVGSVPVPGLIDMAAPAPDTPYLNKVYWCKKTFRIVKSLPEVVLLKIYKAMYHTKVLLNGKAVGENLYCFTPATFDVRKYLNPNGGKNELIIGVGCQNNLPDTILNGHDQERINYIPGIYDNVELQLTGYPYITNIQTAPDPAENKIRINAILKTNGKPDHIVVNYNLSEVTTGKIVLKGDTVIKGDFLDFDLSIPGCKLWSPENPFMYELYMNTGGDEKKIKFGMRSFAFDKDKGIALLNGKPYYMRGTNVCILRFFEDPQRDNLPWDYPWVTRLHTKFKAMHWNSMRYCIGFPPERWYEIADSVGFLIQDEFPLWWGMRNVKANHLVLEYTEWMKERWNHPCVVIWDAQNETVTEETGKAIQSVRNMDLSHRPWDNGWAPPQAESDGMETHPYLMEFLKQVNGTDKYPWTDLYTTVRIPGNGPSDRSPSPDGRPYPNPIIIDEYEWLWLNRDGSPTTLTESVYNQLLGASSTKEQRYECYARILAMDTEYWRAHRKCAGVMYFTGLGYSRTTPPRGQTCDNFIDVRNLIFEPNFERLMRPAFAPVGLMMDIWNAKYKRNTDLIIPVYLYNDTYSDFTDTLKLTVLQENKSLKEISRPITIKSLERGIFNVTLTMPDVTGKCKLVAMIREGPETVISEREFDLVQ